MEAGSGEQQRWAPEAEAEEVPVAGILVLICLFGLVCLAAYVLWRLHRRNGDGLQGSVSLCCECAMIFASGGAVATEATGHGLAQKPARRWSLKGVDPSMFKRNASMARPHHRSSVPRSVSVSQVWLWAACWALCHWLPNLQLPRVLEPAALLQRRRSLC